MVSNLKSYQALSKLQKDLLLKRAAFSQLVTAANISVNIGFEKWLSGHCLNSNYKDLVLELTENISNQK